MNIRLILRIISLLLMIISAFQIPSVIWALWYKEYQVIPAFLIPAAFSFLFFIIMRIISINKENNRLSVKDGFVVVALLWISAAAEGALPFYISGAIDSYTDAFFETMSGFTTTGATILANIELMPKSLLFWRSMTHYLGGMGIVVLTVAVFPLLGIGGVHMVKAEITGPAPAVTKIMPKITETAKILWYIYVALTLVEVFLLILGGMNLFDALLHTFSSISTGGFSSKNLSVGFYDSAYTDWVITLFMIMGGINFTLYFSLITGNIRDIKNNTELKIYLMIFSSAALFIAASLFLSKTYSLADSLRYAGFQAASIMTTTGFSTADYLKWPLFAQMILFLLMITGGCSGSTSGGIKIIRLVIVIKQSFIEMKRLVKPKGIFVLKNDNSVIRKNIVLGILGFITLYFLMAVISASVVASGGYDIMTSVSAAITSLGNIGPGFSLIGPAENYSFFQGYIKWFLSFIMLTGRLELYTILILFTPTFWRK